MTAQIFCIEENGSTPFAVDYFPIETIDTLNGRIYDKIATKPNVKVKDLILWKSEIHIPGHMVADGYYNSYTKDVTKDGSRWLSPNLTLSMKIHLFRLLSYQNHQTRFSREEWKKYASPSKKTRIQEKWRDYKASDGISVELPPAWIDILEGDEFEPAPREEFAKLMKGLQPVLETTDFANKNPSSVMLDFDGYGVMSRQRLSLRKGYEKVLCRGYEGYTRFHFMVGRTFIQVSVSDFANHQKKSDIAKAFTEKFPKKTDRKNQIEGYLDDLFGGDHKAKIVDGSFDVTKRSTKSGEYEPVTDFTVLYIHGREFKPNHTILVDKFKDAKYVGFESLKDTLFANIFK